ncbi:uncharacterized protein LOC126906528 isoform X2 [Daktulosphaira vitifoliae]|uniref:uncharacterized protein LOC126906528 isoform X2 n=1 Tax=Daktulosphaira vitifoliae TaxID=58002 RepID=UPI0021AAAEA1|nr:uncharacterized protein LOC126906528 isoform X2 [Daktulosphaira vitifoliae]
MKNPVLKMFFKHDNASNRSECNLCKKFITGKHSSNLEKHVFAHHKLQYADLIKAKNKLKQTIENLDAETSLTNKHSRSFLCINVQYMSCDSMQLQIKTLSISEVLGGHTAENLKLMVFDVLNKYGLNKNQIYSITIDNARNMIKLTDLIAEHEENVDNENIEDLIVENEPSNFEDEETTLLVRCAAHTLNLCIEDGLKIPVIQQVLSRARHVVKKLRTPTNAGLLKRNNLKLAIIDVDTRWSSTYDMLERLLKLKSFCQEYEETMPDLKVSREDWDKIASMVISLEPSKIGIVMLQRRDIIMGDFFACWWNIMAKLEIINTSLSIAIKNSMKIRGKNLLENPIFFGCKLFRS